MKLIERIFGQLQRKKKVSDLYQETLYKTGRDQIKKLIEKGLSLPIAAF